MPFVNIRNEIDNLSLELLNQLDLIHDELCTAWRLFRRLENQAHRTRETLLLAQQHSRTEHRRHVEIMSAGMHNACVLRLVRQPRLLCNRQSIDIGAQRHHRRSLANLRHNSCL